MGDLIVVDDQAVTSFKDSDFEEMGEVYKPRLQLMTSASAQCKAGEFPVNRYAIINNGTYKDIGENVDAIVVSRRPKAMDLSEGVIVNHDVNSPEFKRIQAASDVKDSGCMFGPEFLLYIPSEKQFVTFFLGSKSARREAPAIWAHKHEAVTLSSTFIETKKYSWQAVKSENCSTPLEAPDQDTLLKEIQEFNNPPEEDLAPEEDRER